MPFEPYFCDCDACSERRRDKGVAIVCRSCRRQIGLEVVNSGWRNDFWYYEPQVLMTAEGVLCKDCRCLHEMPFPGGS